jgi:hypothetical protein
MRLPMATGRLTWPCRRCCQRDAPARFEYAMPGNFRADLSPRSI